jgi:hypothetical protein
MLLKPTRLLTLARLHLTNSGDAGRYIDFSGSGRSIGRTGQQLRVNTGHPRRAALVVTGR